MANFIHLRNHTEYSLSLGAIKLKEMIKRCKEYNMPACAITDTGNMFGVLEYSCLAKDEGVQPIIGCELLLEASNYFENNVDENEIVNNYSKIVLIAQTDEGYYNLLKLASKNFLEKNQVKIPHINIEWLKDKANGIICLTAGYEGLVGKLLLKNKKNLAEKALLELKDIFGDRLYIELMRHGLKQELDTEKDFIEFAYKYNIPLVATNDCYFMNKTSFKAQDILSCIAEGRYYIETDRKRQTVEHYFKTTDEMIKLFNDIPEAIENTVNIAKRISTMSYTRKPTLPHFHIPDGSSEAEYMTKLSRIGLEERLQQKFIIEKITNIEEQNTIRKKYFDQLEYELDIIIKMDFPGYFLIVADFINWSKNNDVPIGPGRGSGAGSVVAWSLKITDLDPIKFELYFERFLNPERVSMPDFDVDFCQRGREKSIQYVKDKYGEEMVAQIITFGKLQARQVVKDVGRVLQMSYNEVDNISKLIPQNLTLEQALEQAPDLRAKQQQDPQLAELISIALELEGLNRHSSIHAAGIVIGDKPLNEICPLYSDGESEMPVIQYTMKYAEKVGLVKFDFLGLKTLTIIKDCISYIKDRNIDINIDNIKLDDKHIYHMLSHGDSIAVFQLESSGMKSILKQMKPDNIEDIIALVSLYRPGPMSSIPTYIARKHGIEKVEYLHPKMESILKDTYGIIIYQEQVMNIAKVLAGYTLGGADVLRRAMGKKIKEEMDKQRSVFVEGAKKHNNIDENLANQIFDLLAKFAEYGFNKAHAAAYSVIGYQTAYLKYYYPVEFMIATMNMDIADSDKLNLYIKDLHNHTIQILPPDVNKSDALFNIERIDIKGERNNDVNKYCEDKELVVRYGLCGVKGIGTNVAEAIVEERVKNGEYKNIFDFIERLDPKYINKKTIQSLSMSGAFDSIHENRKQIYESHEVLSKHSSSYNEEKNSSQLSLFGMMDNTNITKPILVKTDDWINTERHQKEFEVYGFYLWGHPMNIIKKELDDRAITYIDELENSDIQDNDIIRLAGIVISTEIKATRSKTGEHKRYAFVGIADPTSSIELKLFNNDLLISSQDLINDKEHNQLVFECVVKKDESSVNVIINKMERLQDFIKHTTPHTLQKITHRSSKKDEDYQKKQDYWKNKNAKIKQEQNMNNDPILLKKQEDNIKKRNKMIAKMELEVSDGKSLPILQKILNISKNNNSNSPSTAVLMYIKKDNQEVVIDLGVGYRLYELEKSRIQDIKGIFIKNIEYTDK